MLGTKVRIEGGSHATFSEYCVPPSDFNLTADFATDDIDRKLDVLLQQQKQMEKWKPKK